MLATQIIISLFILFALTKLIGQKKADKISTKAFVLWVILWLAVGIVFWKPETASYLANKTGIGRGADLVIYASIIVIFYLLFRIFVHLNKINANLSKIVQEVAINNATQGHNLKEEQDVK